MKEKKTDMVTASTEALQMSCIAYAQNGKLEISDRLAYAEMACKLQELHLKAKQQELDNKKILVAAGLTGVTIGGYCVAAKFVDPFKVVSAAGKDAMHAIVAAPSTLLKLFIH